MTTTKQFVEECSGWPEGVFRIAEEATKIEDNANLRSIAKVLLAANDKFMQLLDDEGFEWG